MSNGQGFEEKEREREIRRGPDHVGREVREERDGRQGVAGRGRRRQGRGSDAEQRDGEQPGKSGARHSQPRFRVS